MISSIPISKELNNMLLSMLENNERITDYRIDLDILKKYLTDEDKDTIMKFGQDFLIEKIKNPLLIQLINSLILNNKG
jgi:hypothetical protein